MNDPDALEPSAEDGQLLMTHDIPRLRTVKDPGVVGIALFPNGGGNLSRE